MLLAFIAFLLFSAFVGQTVQQKLLNNNELRLKLVPSLAQQHHQQQSHTLYYYYVIAHCMDRDGVSQGADSGLAQNEHDSSLSSSSSSSPLPAADSGQEEASTTAAASCITFRFTTAERCAHYTVYVGMRMTSSPLLVNSVVDHAWPISYSRTNLKNDGLNKLILFGNHFNLSIGPTLETPELFYQVRVYCAETEEHKSTVEIDVDAGKTTEKWSMSEANHFESKFNTFTKGTTTRVVFNSEKRQCRAYSKYHIKVWATHTAWMDSEPTDRPIVHYVCKSNRNGENWKILLLNHFQLRIKPALAERKALVYYVEVQCHGKEGQTFKTVTRHMTDVVLHIFKCKMYDIWMVKVPLDLIGHQQLPGYKEMLDQQKRGDEGVFASKVRVANGQSVVLDFYKRQRTKMNGHPSAIVEREGKVAQKTDNHKQLARIIHISDSEEEDEHGREKEDNDCSFFQPL